MDRRFRFGVACSSALHLLSSSQGARTKTLHAREKLVHRKSSRRSIWVGRLLNLLRRTSSWCSKPIRPFMFTNLSASQSRSQLHPSPSSPICLWLDNLESDALQWNLASQNSNWFHQPSHRAYSVRCSAEPRIVLGKNGNHRLLRRPYVPTGYKSRDLRIDVDATEQKRLGCCNSRTYAPAERITSSCHQSSWQQQPSSLPLPPSVSSGKQGPISRNNHPHAPKNVVRGISIRPPHKPKERRFYVGGKEREGGNSHLHPAPCSASLVP